MLERKGRETYGTDQHNEVSNTYKITSSESPRLIGCEEISNLARHKEEYNTHTAPKIDQSQYAYKREYNKNYYVSLNSLSFLKIVSMQP